MKSKIFTVLDKATGAFLPPFFSITEGQAVRSFTECAQDSTHAFRRHHGDFALYSLGVFDDASGDFTTHTPQFIISATAASAMPMRPVAPVDDQVVVDYINKNQAGEI